MDGGAGLAGSMTSDDAAHDPRGPEVVLVVDSGHVVRSASPSASTAFSVPADKLDDTPLFDLVYRGDRGRLNDALLRIQRDPSTPQNLAVRVLYDLPRAPWAELTVQPLHTGEADSIVVTIRPFLSGATQEPAPDPDGDRYHALVQNSSDIVLVTDPDGIVRFANTAMLRTLGARPDELLSSQILDILHPDDHDSVTAAMVRVLEHPDKVARVEMRARRADGSYRWIEGSIRNLLDNPEVRGILGNGRDITDRRLAEAALRASEERFRSLAASSPSAIFECDLDGHLTYANDRWFEITGRDVGLDDTVWSVIHPDDAGVLRDRWEAEASLDGFGIRFRVHRPDGSDRWVDACTTPLRAGNGVVEGHVGTLHDVTDLVAARRESLRFQAIVENTPDVVAIVGEDLAVEFLNRSAREVFGVGERTDLGSLELQHGFSEAAWVQLLGGTLDAVTDEHVWSGELNLLRADGSEIPMSQVVLAGTDDEGESRWYASIARDISDLKHYQHELVRQARHDPLTGLPNRMLLIERLATALEKAGAEEDVVALLFIDLDRFKVVNDSLGHQAGDELLVALADRLVATVRPGDLVARFGGDEFVIVCEGVEGPETAIALADRILQQTAGLVDVGDSQVHVSVSIGVVVASGHEKPGELLRDADAAMYVAKSRGRDRVEVFDHDLRARVVTRLATEQALRRGIERDEFLLHFQPVIDLRSGAILGAEALLRWNHPESGQLGPAKFLAVAEESGLLQPLGSWVLQEACRQAVSWTVIEGGRPVDVFVNISAGQLSDPGLVDEVRLVLESSGIAPERLLLEVTEGTLMADAAATSKVLGALRALGVRIAVDDFGTGYSSLSYLTRLPVDLLKVDQSFVFGIGHRSGDQEVTAAIVALAHTLGMQAVAEGVETAEQLAELRALGCDMAQGFRFSAPLCAADFAEMLARGDYIL